MNPENPTGPAAATTAGSATADDVAWQPHARALARQLTDAGDLRDPAWADAVAAVPRHLLVPRAVRQRPDGAWVEIDTSGDFDLVFSPTTLVTQVINGIGVSSSTKPDLMLRMLELLRIAPGHRVLEIGTGTGYNAALLCKRLGDHNVFSVDVDEHLVDVARERLAAIGHRPTLAALDGAGGWPEHSPYDRIIATCSVPRVPWAWAEQLVPGGRLLADVKIGAAAGNLALLHRVDDRLEGRFTSRWAGFMTLRHHTDDVPAPDPPARVDHAPDERTSVAPAQPWSSHRPVWMLAGAQLPPGTTHGYTLDPDTRTPTESTLAAPDGSWCHIALAPDDPERPRRVREAGPTPLWQHVEAAYRDWRAWGEPGWERFGLTVIEHDQAVWLDTPTERVI